MLSRVIMTACLLAGACTSHGEAAELSVGSVAAKPGGTVELIVSGQIEGESTFGVTIMLALSPRGGNTGSVTFTPSRKPTAKPHRTLTLHEHGRHQTIAVTTVEEVDVDVAEVTSPWAAAGNFSAFDTNSAGSLLFNGSVQDNGVFSPAPITYSGHLARFPLIASKDASGVWDVILTTPAGDSGWEGLETKLVTGTVTITSSACVVDQDCNDADASTLDACVVGVCLHTAEDNKGRSPGSPITSRPKARTKNRAHR